MILRRLLFSVFAVAALLVPGTAPAQTNDADRAKARVLANEGYDALDRKDYPTAAERFERADGLFHVATVALGLARAQVGIGRLVQAQETYRRIVREGAPRGAPAPIVKAVADARRELDDLSPRVPGVILAVSGGGAPQVTLDGTPVSAAALGVALPVNPGDHVIRASADGYRSFRVSVTVAEGKRVPVAIEMRPDPSAAQPGPRATAGAEGERASGPWPAQRIAGAALTVAGAAGVVVGGVFAAEAHGKFTDLSSKCPTRNNCDASLASELGTYHTDSSASVAGFVAGGVLAGAGIVVFLTAPKAKTASGAFIAPRVGVGYAGFEGGF